jgi:hypothetical protein
MSDATRQKSKSAAACGALIKTLPSNALNQKESVVILSGAAFQAKRRISISSIPAGK